MYALFRSADRNNESGSALPMVWKTLWEAEIRFYRGDLYMVAGPPGTGKSILALQMAIEMRVPTLYVSCDMGAFLTAARAAAVVTGTPINQVKEDLGTPAGRLHYRQALTRIGHLYMAYESRPSPEDIQEIVQAFEELWGCPPECIIVDNLHNLFSGSETEWTGLREMSHVFHFLAHEMGAAVVLLHHTNLAGHGDITVPGPISALKGQIHELPAVIVHMAGAPGKLRLCAVKNRHGKSDPSGKRYVELDFNEPVGVLQDPQPVMSGWNVPATVPDWMSRSSNDL